MQQIISRVLNHVGGTGRLARRLPFPTLLHADVPELPLTSSRIASTMCT
jgi:hypothetical protein